MSRGPITWQNVNSPAAGTATLIEAMLRGGREAQAGIEQIGNVFKTARDEMQAAATGAAVAQIANSENPLAVAQAAPKGWQFDPLAIATAANARKEQLGEEEVRQSNLATDLLQRQATQSELKDREDKRLGALAASKGFEYIDRTGKIPEFAPDDPLAGTQAGIYAQEAWREHLKEKQAFDLDKERLGIDRARAAREARMEQQDKAKQGYLAELNDLALKPENFNLEPGARAKLNQKVAEKWGVGHLALEGDAHFANAIKSNLPTDAQLDSRDSRGYNRKDVISGFMVEKANIDAAKNVELAGFKTAKEVALQSAQSEYKGLTEEQMYQKFLDKHKAVTQGSWIGTNWEPKDVGQRADIIQAEARRRGFNIERHDAVEMVASTIGAFTTGDKDSRIITDETSAMIDRYGSFAKFGDVANLNLAMTEIERAAAAKSAAVDKAINATLRSAATGEDLDTEVAKQFETTPVGRKQALETELSVLEAALAQKSTNLAPGAKVDTAELTRMARRVTSLREQLKKVVVETTP